MAGMRFTIRSEADLIKAINKYGFLPFFRNSIEGFSIEEHIAPEHWYYSDSAQWDAWDWKGPVIQKTGCAYGKFFEHKAVYISRDWFPDFANYRRDGYDFDARYDEGLAKHTDKVLYDLLDSHAPVISKELKLKLSITLDTLTARILKLSSDSQSRIEPTPFYSWWEPTDCRADSAVTPVAHKISPDHRF